MRDIVDVKKYLRENPDALAVSVYDRLERGVLCSFPVDDLVLYAEDVKCSEILPYMEPEYNGVPWPLIWAKIKKDRKL